MKMNFALKIIAGYTLFLGLTQFATASLQERVSTCENQLNLLLLQEISHLQMSSSCETKIAQHVLSVQIQRATGVAGPIGENFAKLIKEINELNRKAYTISKSMEIMLLRGCEEERSQWYLLSFIALLVNSVAACCAFWLGFRVVNDGNRI